MRVSFPPNTALNVILLDSLNSTFLNQAYVRIEMVKFLEKLPQGQPVAVFTLGRKLHMVQDFTTDLTQLKAVVKAFKGQSSPLMQDPTGTSEVWMVPQGLAAQVIARDDPEMLMQMKDFAEQTTSDQSDMRVQYTFSALLSLGRKIFQISGSPNLFVPGKTGLSRRSGSSKRVSTASSRKPGHRACTTSASHQTSPPSTAGLLQFRSGCSV